MPWRELNVKKYPAITFLDGYIIAFDYYSGQKPYVFKIPKVATDWIKDNNITEYIIYDTWILFKNKEDAMAFKLRWM